MDPLQNQVINFIDEVNKKRSFDDTVDKINNDPVVKLRRLNETKQQGVNACMNSIFAKICSNAIPEINGRTACTPDLDKVVANYIANRTGGKDLEFYVKEAIRRNPKHTSVVKNVFESVEKIVRDTYSDKTLNPETITEEDYKFEITPEIDNKLSMLVKDNNLDDLAEVIKDNVRNTAVAEVELAKKEKEERMALEEELTNDESITTESALEEALRERGIGQKTSYYNPSLFEAVMISKFNESVIDDTIDNFVYAAESSFVTEGVIEKIKSTFKAKAEADAKETIAKNHTTFTATIEAMYKAVYAEYRSKVSPINVTKMVKMCKSILSSSNVGDVSFKSKVNLAEVKEVSSSYREKMKGLMDSKNFEKFSVPKSGKTYTGSEAISEMASAVKALDTFFSKPDVKSFVNKASSYVAVKANKCASPKEVNTVYKLAVEYYVAELAYYVQAIDFTVNVAKFAKDLIAKYDHTDVKEAAFDNAVTEYTLLSISKALYLESFGLMDIDRIAREYAKN